MLVINGVYIYCVDSISLELGLHCFMYICNISYLVELLLLMEKLLLFNLFIYFLFLISDMCFIAWGVCLSVVNNNLSDGYDIVKRLIGNNQE